jgi:ribulose-phosphate 3-epimerase
VSLNPATPVSAVEHVLGVADLVLVMSVNPGFGGQKFLPEVLPKIARLRELATRREGTLHVEVDGGIIDQTIGDVRRSGADAFVAVGSNDYADRIRRLREACG